MTSALYVRDKIQLARLPETGVLKGDSSYPSGGYTLDHVFGAGLKYPKGANQIGSNAAANAYDVRFDFENQRLRVYNRNAAPAIIVEEAMTVSSNAGRLARVPGYILGVEVTAGGTTGAFTIIPTGKTPTTTQVAVNFVTGAFAFLSTDAVTAARVTYIPLGAGPFIEANRVVDEARTAVANTFNFANRAALIQYVYNNTASGAARRPKLIPVGESPGSNEIAIDINNSTATTVTTNASQGTNAFLVTYWKFSAIGAAYGWTDQADITVTSDAISFTEVLDIPGIFIGAFGDVVIGETGAAANLQARLIGPSGSTAANVAVFDPSKNLLSLASGDAYATVESAFIVLTQQQQSAASEVPAGTNLTGFQWELAVFSAQG